MKKQENYVETFIANMHHKDTVFRRVFSDKKELLTLYNAVNKTCYDNTEELEITTLENAVYMTIKNDLSCVIDMRLNLYEHQSSVNPNMPLRDLDYVSRSFRHFYDGKDIYSEKLIKLPNPKFVVFYNGIDKQPERKEFRLSDAYTHREENPSLELVVLQLNINPGYNDELMKACPTLREYMLFVDKIRKCSKTMDINTAVTRSVDECIKENILADFLRKNKMEVIAMSIYEYDAELHEKTLQEIGYEKGHVDGRNEGIGIGRKQGEAKKLITQICRKKQKSKSPEVIAEELEEDFEQVKRIYDIADRFAPEYDVEKIYERLVSI
ncbi:MAG: transposase [Clostridium sp.]|nr:transposase [Clostridium sp.]MCM1170797.1 transposase [Clostridium sp.]